MQTARTSEDLRAHNRVRLLRAVHDGAGTLTRSQLTRQLGMARGTASVLVAELTQSRLLAEAPATAGGRGRPTRIPGPHPQGPVALMVDLREDHWTIGTGELGGTATTVEHGEHNGVAQNAFPSLAAALRVHADRLGDRAIGVGVSVAGPVRAGRLVHMSSRGWQEVDVSAFLDLAPLGLLLGNDATLAGLAEARRGVLRGVGTALHVHVDFDVGGCLILDGQPMNGAHGMAGEFGHMPLAGGTRPCPCGASGCWSLDVGSNALLRAAGIKAGYRQGRHAARDVIARVEAGDPQAVEAMAANAKRLGRGLGALCNGNDLEAISLSGFAGEVHHHARETVESAYLAALMDFHRADPPPITPSTLGESGPLTGALELVFDAFLSPAGLARWGR